MKIDKCMADEIREANRRGIKTLASCCGHGKYPKTIVASVFDWNYEIKSEKDIPREKRFYVEDSKGFYFIPETL